MKDKKKWFDSAIIKEDESKATANSKHFKMNNGTEKIVISKDPIHYRDKNNRLVEIDNSLKQTEEGYRANFGNHSVHISDKEANEKVVISDAESLISWEYIGVEKPDFADNSKKGKGTHTKKKGRIKVEPSIPSGKKIGAASKVRFEETEGNVDLEYVISGNKIKENIVVKSVAEEYKYYFLFNASGYEMQASESGDSLEFYKIENDTANTLDFTMPSPFMYDAKGAKSENVHYNIEQVEDGKYLLSVEADPEWINSEDRVFPVYIDPTLSTATHEDTGVSIYATEYIKEVTYSECGESHMTEYAYSNPKDLTLITEASMCKDLGFRIYTSYLLQHENMSHVISSAYLCIAFDSYTANGVLIGNSFIPFESMEENSLGQKIVKINIKNDILDEKNKEVEVRVAVAAKYDELDNPVSVSATIAEMPYVELTCCTNSYDNKAIVEFNPIENVNVLSDLSTGEYEIGFEDITDPMLGISISHHQKKSDENHSVGKNFRLNINETLKKRGDNDYVYTDALGIEHTFDEVYYILDGDGNKQTVDKSAVSIDLDGTLWYNGTCRAYRMLTSKDGHKMVADVEGVNGAEWYEKRIDEEKQLEEQKNSYKNAILSFVQVTNEADANVVISDSVTVDELEGVDDILTKISSVKSNANTLLLSKDEAYSYLSLLTQKQALDNSKTSLETQKESLWESLKATWKNFSSIDSADSNPSLSYQIGLAKNERASLLLKKKEYEDNNSEEETSDDEILLGSSSDDESKEVQIDGVYHYTSFALLKQHEKSLIQQQFEYNNQYELLKSQVVSYPTSWQDSYDLSILQEGVEYGTLIKQLRDTDNQIHNIVLQIDRADEQIQLMHDKSDKYIEEAQKYYKEYVNLENQLINMRKQIPVSYIRTEEGVKGFNSDGDLVVVQDKYGKYVIFNYERASSNGKWRISTIVDENNRGITFEYSVDGLLKSLKNSKGETTSYTYDESSGKLIKVQFANDKVLEICYSNDYVYSVGYPYIAFDDGIEHVKYYEQAIFIRDDMHFLKCIKTMTVVDSISNGLVTPSSSVNDVSRVDIEYNTNGAVVTYSDGSARGYVYNDECYLTDYYETVNDNVTLYERYEYSGNIRTKVIHSRESDLNFSINYFNFVAGNTESIELTSFNEVGKRTSTICSSDGTVLEEIIEENTYGADRKITGKKITRIDKQDDDSTTIAREKYYYDNAGNMIRKESYVEGEEHTNGVSIEEHVYNDKGYEIKSFSYNSLDTSSKFYTEHEIDDNGIPVSSFDSTGEHKTIVEYEADGACVRTEKLPNGSKFSYGRSSDGTVTAITHSTDEGEENSTQKHYTRGLLTELRSGNNVVNYSYDHKRRVTAVQLNNQENYVEYSYSGDNTDSATTIATMKDGTVHKAEKDKAGNVKQIACGTESVKNTYNSDNLLKTCVDSVSGTTTYAYDNEGRLVSVDSPSVDEAYVYDNYGKLTSKTVDNKTYAYTYSTDSTKKLESITVNGITVAPKTDVNGRHAGKAISVGNTKIDEEYITYLKFGDHATNMPSTVRHKDNIIKYKYDNMGNISEIRENGILTARYSYDSIGRLVREDNKHSFTTTLYTYDNNGNILFKKNHAFTLNDADYLEEMEYTVDSYNYDGEKLMSYNGESFEYDVIGNPTTYRGKAATWNQGRRLVRYDGNTFTYDARGRRTGKNNISFTYDSNGNLIKQTDGTTTLEFIYDHTGVCAVVHNGSTYFYRKNAQGDIISLLDNAGKVSVYYRYNAWGACTVLDANGAQIDDTSHIGNLNPFKYRSYYYDTETKLYFLKTRYYDPEICRFITIDDISYLDPKSINGLNLYAYCGNNPIKYSDPNGTSITLGVILGIIALAGLITTCIGVATDNNIVTAVGLTMVAIPALISGGMALIGGITAGATLTAFIGGGTVLAGVGTGLFASAEYQEAFTGSNWILETTGMSESLYNGLMIAIATIATLGTFASSFAYNFKIKSVDKVGKLRPQNHPDEGYFGVRFKDARGSLKSIEIQKHAPHGLHFQLNSWNPMHMSVKTIRRWTWYLTRM